MMNNLANQEGCVEGFNELSKRKLAYNSRSKENRPEA